MCRPVGVGLPSAVPGPVGLQGPGGDARTFRNFALSLHAAFTRGAGAWSYRVPVQFFEIEASRHVCVWGLVLTRLRC